MRPELVAGAFGLALLACAACAKPINRLLGLRLRAKEKRLRRRERETRNAAAEKLKRARVSTDAMN